MHWSAFLRVVISFCALGVALTGWGKEHFQVEPRFLVGAVAAHAGVFASNLAFVRHERFCDPRWWGACLRGLTFALTIADVSVWAAASRSDASPAWALMMLLPMFLGRVVPHSIPVAVMLVAVPCGLRALAVPDASALSFVIALMVCTVATGFYMLESLRSEALWSRIGQVDAQTILSAEEAAGALEASPGARADKALHSRVAASLHDQLSGRLVRALSLLARGGGKDPETLGDVLSAARAVVREARGFLINLRDRRHLLPDLNAFRADLEGYATSLGVRCALQIDGSAYSLSAEECDDVRDIASECVTNSARYCEPDVELRVSFTGQRVLIRCAGRRNKAEPFEARRGGGNGLRNMRLRARRYGGSFRADIHGERPCLTIGWPTGNAASSPGWMQEWWNWAWYPLVALLVGSLLAVASGMVWAFSLVFAGTLYSSWAIASYVHFGEQLRQKYESLRELRQRAPRALVHGFIVEAFDPILSLLDQALREEALAGVKRSLYALNRAYEDVQWALEFEGDHEALVADLAFFAGEHGARFDPTRVTDDAVNDLGARYRLRAAIQLAE